MYWSDPREAKLRRIVGYGLAIMLSLSMTIGLLIAGCVWGLF